MAVTMICIGMPVCRPAVSSMLEAVGILKTEHRSSITGGSKPHNKKSGSAGAGYPATSSYIRNFGQDATWEQAVRRGVDDGGGGGGDINDLDSWSQRRILGLGHATSHCVTTTTTTRANSIGGAGDESSGSDVDKVMKVGEDAFGGEVGFPMRSMSKSGITVTKTVDVTKH